MTIDLLSDALARGAEKPVSYRRAPQSHAGCAVHQTLRDLPNIEALEDAAMLHKDYLAAEEIPIATSYDDDAQSLDGDID